MNLFLRMTNDCVDNTVFVGSWLKKLNVWNKKNQQASVILNGSNKKIFNSINGSFWNRKNPLKIVTHHWSNNINKGFDIYKYLDDLLDNKRWKKRIRFTYIGNIPKNFKFRNTNLIEPKEDNELSAILKSNHIYLTASINEPGGNHQNEGGMCGLPLLYRDSGCMQEYCKGFGVDFQNKEDFLNALKMIMKNYPIFKSKMKNFNRDINMTTKSYIKLFNFLISNNNEIVKNRRNVKNPIKYLFNLLIN